MSEWLIDVSDVVRIYGSEPVLRRLDLKVGRGSIYGFLGRNGAGKSTLIRSLVGLDRPDAGSIRVLGVDPMTWKPEIQARCGYMSDGQVLPGTMKAGKLLEWTRPLYPSWNKDLVSRLVSRFRLNLNKRVGELSLGQQRQLAFIMALAPCPDLLILDEPAANLDTVARRAFLDEMLSLLREENKTVFFSTHILSDVERVADHIGILSEGKMAISEPLDHLKETVKEVRFFWEKPEPPPVSMGRAFGGSKGRGEAVFTLRLEKEEELQALASRAGCQWEMRSLNLEDLFVSLTLEKGEIV